MMIQNGRVYALKPLLSQLTELDVPARVGVQVVRLVKKLGAEINSIDQARDKLILKYGETNENGVPQLYGPGQSEHEVSPRWGEFIAEVNDLMTAEVDIEFNKLQLPGETEVSIPVLLAFEDFIEVAE